MDLTLGSGWPYGGPQVPITDAAATLRTERVKVQPNSRCIPLPNIGPGEKFLAAFAADNLRELTDVHDGAVWLDGNPEGPQEILFFVASRTGMQVKRPAVGAEGYVLNHLDARATERYLKNVGDRLLQAFGSNPPYAVFCDSLEVYNQDWTPDFLEEFKPAAVSRLDKGRLDAKEAAVRSAVLAENAHLVLPPFASSIFVGNAGAIVDAPPGDSGTGAINSGWVFPEDPSHIRVTTSSQNDVACFLAVAGPPDPEFAVNFTFIPATTATYSMTAILAFHGFYVLRSDDSWWNCRHAEVKLSVQMNVHQYVDIGWQQFPALIDRNESNDEEVTTYDRTQFFDYTPVVLKAGDPVIVTVKGTLHAFARGSGAFAELNFNDGTAASAFPNASATIACVSASGGTCAANPTSPHSYDITLTWSQKLVAMSKTTQTTQTSTPVSIVMHVQP